MHAGVGKKQTKLNRTHPYEVKPNQSICFNHLVQDSISQIVWFGFKTNQTKKLNYFLIRLINILITLKFNIFNINN